MSYHLSELCRFFHATLNLMVVFLSFFLSVESYMVKYSLCLSHVGLLVFIFAVALVSYVKILPPRNIIYMRGGISTFGESDNNIFPCAERERERERCPFELASPKF